MFLAIRLLTLYIGQTMEAAWKPFCRTYGSVRMLAKAPGFSMIAVLTLRWVSEQTRRFFSSLMLFAYAPCPLATPTLSQNSTHWRRYKIMSPAYR
jgi:hypothetical protein